MYGPVVVAAWPDSCEGAKSAMHISKAAELIRRPDLKAEWKQKLDILLEDKIDVTQFMVDFVEHYSEKNRKNSKAARQVSA